MFIGESCVFIEGAFVFTPALRVKSKRSRLHRTNFIQNLLCFQVKLGSFFHNLHNVRSYLTEIATTSFLILSTLHFSLYMWKWKVFFCAQHMQWTFSHQTISLHKRKPNHCMQIYIEIATAVYSSLFFLIVFIFFIDGSFCEQLPQYWARCFVS